MCVMAAPNRPHLAVGAMDAGDLPATTKVLKGAGGVAGVGRVLPVNARVGPYSTTP